MARIAEQERDTRETHIRVRLNLDGTGQYEDPVSKKRKISTGHGVLNHLLESLSKHSMIDLEVQVIRGDTDVGWHHITEDIGILMGRAFKEAVGSAKGIRRMASFFAPLDEALAFACVDFGGRGYFVFSQGEIGDSDLNGLPGDLIRHFLESLAREGGFNLHVMIISGINNHHKAEAVLKATARAVRAALELDERALGQIPSTKGVIG